jgi:hypothetical protein
MCIIAIKFTGITLPTDEHLKNCAEKNKDGIGIAYMKAGANEVKIKKDFKDITVFLTWLHENIKKEDKCVIHFRWATHGLVDIGNRHPFPITKNKEMLRQAESICQMAVAHNGVIREYGHGQKYSDTQKFVLDILSDDVVKNNLENATVQKLIANFIEGDRLVILRNDGMMFYWGEWVKEGDIYYSNDGYKTVAWHSDYFNKGDKGNNYTWVDNCEFCGEKKSLKWVETVNHVGFMLCKKCRKQYKKGQLNLGANEQNLTTEEDRPLLTQLEKANSKEKQCENCYEIKPAEKVVLYFGSQVCVDCIKGFPA